MADVNITLIAIAVKLCIVGFFWMCYYKYKKKRNENCNNATIALTTLPQAPQRTDLENVSTPTPYYSQNNFRPMPTSMPIPTSEYYGNGNNPLTPHPPVFSRYPPESTQLGSGNLTATNVTSHTSGTKSHSAEELPPSYMEAVKYEQQATGQQQGHRTSDT